MAVYQRDSPFWWMLLEGSGHRLSTKVPIGTTAAAKKASRLEAEDIYRAAMGDLARGTFKLPTAKQPRTFRQHATWYRDHVTTTHRSQQRERSAIVGLIRRFGDTPLSDLTTAAIEAWKLARAKVVKQSTVNRELEVLKPLLQSAAPQYLDVNPARAVAKFRLRYPPIALLTPEAEAAILAVASPAERAFVLLGLDALLRLSDVRRLRVEHDHGAYLQIIDPKVEAYKVPVSTRLRAALDALAPKGGYYFPRKYGGTWHAISAVTAHAYFAGLCRRAGVITGRAAGGVTFHGLRHTGATRAARVVKLTVVQRLGGWKNLTQLARYDHPDDPESVRAVEAIGGVREAHAPITIPENMKETG
jgi:integrase